MMLGQPHSESTTSGTDNNKMPDYLKYNSHLASLAPHEITVQLEEQKKKLDHAMSRLQEADKVRPEVFDSVVSV
jgi:division protein CdvB (Snf7/Vps24/ESCRT-III family)